MSAEGQEPLSDGTSWQRHPMVIFNGAKAGKPAGTITLRELFEMEPQTVEKTAALAFIPSRYAGPDARRAKAQEQRGEYVALVADYDGGCADVKSALPAAIDAFTRGGPWFVYTTASSTAESLRLRIVVPLAQPVPFADWQAAQLALQEHLNSHGVPTDASARKAAQLSFVPNAPSGFFRQSIVNPDAPPLSFGSLNLEPVSQDQRAARKADKTPLCELDTKEAIERAIAFLEHQEPAVERQGGDLWTVKTANLVMDMGLSPDMCFELMAEHWNDRCSPPWELEGANSLRAKVDSAAKSRLSSLGVSSPEVEFAGVRVEAPDRQASRESRYTLLSLDDLENEPARDPVIQGLLARGDVCCIFGEPGAGKSLLAPYLALRVARGDTAFRLKTKQGPVIYVGTEDPHGMGSRLRALRYKHGDASELYLAKGLAGAMLDLDSPELVALITDVKRLCPVLVVIDTLATGFPIDENSSVEMGKVVQTLRALSDLGPAVIIVHHSPKGDSWTPRGHSSLNGDLDVTIRVEASGTDKVTRCAVLKNRNGAPKRFGFKIDIESERLGEDAFGDKVTAARCEEIDLNLYPKGGDLSGAQLRALSFLDELAGADGRVSLAEWRDKCTALGALSDAEGKKSRDRAFTRAKGQLLGKRLIREGSNEGGPWIARPEFVFVPASGDQIFQA